MHCSPRKRTAFSKSDSMRALRTLTEFARFKARICDGFWKTNSARFAHSVRFTTCGINGDTHHWFLVPSTETRIKTRNRLLKKFPETVQAIARQHSEKRVRIFFQGEARFGQQGTLTRIWAPKGSRPRTVRQTQYDDLWVLGVVCPETGQAEGLLSPCLNTERINVFLKQFSETIPVDEHAVVVWDGAGFHRSQKVLRLRLLMPHCRTATNVACLFAGREEASYRRKRNQRIPPLSI